LRAVRPAGVAVPVRQILRAVQIVGQRDPVRRRAILLLGVPRGLRLCPGESGAFVNGETKRAHLKLSGGPELISAAAATVEHFAQEAGLDDISQRNLMEACEQVCGDALRGAESGGDALEVSVEQHADRIEIGVVHPSLRGPAVGLDSFLGTASGGEEPTGISLMARVDRVQYDSAGPGSRMILVKYLPGAKKKAN